jgi:hypothetical protein
MASKSTTTPIINIHNTESILIASDNNYDYLYSRHNIRMMVMMTALTMRMTITILASSMKAAAILCSHNVNFSMSMNCV